MPRQLGGFEGYLKQLEEEGKADPEVQRINKEIAKKKEKEKQDSIKGKK